MEIQILSDLHLETPRSYDIFEIVPKAPYLALLGDIGNVGSDQSEFLDWITRQLRQFRAVFLVPGNHEAFQTSWPNALAVLGDFERTIQKDDSLGDFVLLDRRAYEIPNSDVVILGCSLFSFIPPESENDISFGLNDFYRTSDWDTTMHNAAHERDLAWLNSKVAEYDASEARIVILSHWSPSVDTRALDPRHVNSPISGAFSTDLSGEACFKSPQVRLWAFGHTHYNCDFMVDRGDHVGPLRIYTNQRGYYFSQAPRFDAERVVQIL
ncbi:unnamed protein product [Clonostachys rosea f. rosea IK726]|jgi:hypothetical protein|uniref:Uncharacterized protein n=1 Tax=Clonostachys rosea f. rosea IK726 TaxID=1349383 RepID=A0ACA9UHR6_BIOOC|nr:unnamed protein product [Clonostachys rosea f. rosea IK726]